MSLGAFADDGQRTMLATVLSHTQAVEVVAAKGGLSAQTLAVVKQYCSQTECGYSCPDIVLE